MGKKEETTNKTKQRTGYGHPINNNPGCATRKRGQGVSPCDEYLKGVKRSADQLKV